MALRRGLGWGEKRFFEFRRIHGYFQWLLGIFNFSALLLLIYERTILDSLLPYGLFLILFWPSIIIIETLIGKKEWKTVRVDEMKHVWKDHPLHKEMDTIIERLARIENNQRRGGNIES